MFRMSALGTTCDWFLSRLLGSADDSLVDTAYREHVNVSCPDCLTTTWLNIKERRKMELGW